MKSFRDYLSEEVLPSVQVADGGLDIDKPAVRAAINAAIAGVVSQPAVTPYVVYNRLSKLLAQYHINLPRKFLEGDKGVEVFELRQYGNKMGMTDSGEFVNEVPSTHYLFLQYAVISTLGVTYVKPTVGGMFRVTARIVDKAELDGLLDMAEISLREDAECRLNAAKAMAPKEPLTDIAGDEKKVGNKKAVATSQKGLNEGRPSQRHPLEGHDYHRKSDAELLYIGKDAHAAAQAMKSHNPQAEGKYLDQANDAATVRHFRKTSGRPEWYQRKYGHIKEETLEEALSHGARELTLYADNHRDLHRQSHEPIVKNLQRKHDKGTYDHEKAKKLWGYHAKRASDAYHKEFGHKFSKSERDEAASHFADEAKSEHGFGTVKEEKKNLAEISDKLKLSYLNKSHDETFPRDGSKGKKLSPRKSWNRTAGYMRAVDPEEAKHRDLYAYQADRKKLEELYGKGDIEAIASAHHKKAMAKRDSVPDSENSHIAAHERAGVLKNMRDSSNRGAYKGMAKVARDEQKKREVKEDNE